MRDHLCPFFNGTVVTEYKFLISAGHNTGHLERAV